MEAPGLPDEFIFQRLVDVANQNLKSGTVTLRDHQGGWDVNGADLVADILELQQVLLKKLSPEARTALDAGQDVFILLSAPAGYEWAVGFLAIASLGASPAGIGKSSIPPYRQTHTPLPSSSSSSSFRSSN
jgi:malonyl-CoA/methylmalonyl-CoA synthetase